MSLLRASGEALDTSIDASAVAEGANVPAGAQLVRFAEAAVTRAPALANRRRELERRLGRPVWWRRPLRFRLSRVSIGLRMRPVSSLTMGSTPKAVISEVLWIWSGLRVRPTRLTVGWTKNERPTSFPCSADLFWR